MRATRPAATAWPASVRMSLDGFRETARRSPAGRGGADGAGPGRQRRSSSLKLRLLDARDAIEHSADLPAGPGGFDASSLAGVLRGWGEPDAVGHRIVHGGTMFAGPVLIDGAVREQLRALTDLAPLHQPKSGRARRGHRAAARRARGRLLRHRLPRHHPPGRRDLRGAP